jgi:hypothetical protein
MPGEPALIAIIAVAFLILHILAGTILHAAAGAPAAPAQEAPSRLYD